MKKPYVIGKIALISFILNLIWENIQAPLYIGFRSFSQHFLFCLIATLGDVTIILGLYFLFALSFRSYYWIKHWSLKKASLLIIASGVVAFAIEKWALQGYWSYKPTMPVVPFLEIGLAPLLQLLILPLFTFYLAIKLSKI